jgi:uncharacterized damage-inducible protein DinB
MEFVTSFKSAFEANKSLADRALEQVPDARLHIPLDANTNSLAVIVKHVAGNLISRWTDFLTTDGEKDWRNRDDEFVDTYSDRVQMMAYWEQGWTCLAEALSKLQPGDLAKTVTIRGEPHTVPLAMARSLGHTCYHVGQIVQLAWFHAGDRWRTLTIPRGGSLVYNQQYWAAQGKSHS